MVITTHGYEAVFLPDNPMAHSNGYVYRHRLIMAEKLGRPLKRSEQVHHIDGNKRNNAVENLQLVSDREHRVFHRKSGKKLRMPGEPNPIVQCECGCGTKFRRYDADGRPRRIRPGHFGRKPLP